MPDGLTPEQIAARTALERAETLDQYWLALNQALESGFLTPEEIDIHWRSFQEHPEAETFRAVAAARTVTERKAETQKQVKLGKTAAFYGMPVETLKNIQEAYKEKPELYGAALEKRLELVEERERKQAEARLKATPLEPRYGLVEQQFTEQLQGPGAYKEWFANKYPSILEQFYYAKGKGYFTRGGWAEEYTREEREAGERQEYLSKAEAERQVEKGWSEYLKTEKPKLYEEWYMKSPYERGERPSAYQPRVRTVGF